jgi:hypothetical protein
MVVVIWAIMEQLAQRDSDGKKRVGHSVSWKKFVTQEAAVRSK